MPRLISGRTGFSAAVTSKSGKIFATGGFGFYNSALNKTEVLEKKMDLDQQKWELGMEHVQ